METKTLTSDLCKEKGAHTNMTRNEMHLFRKRASFIFQGRTTDVVGGLCTPGVHPTFFTPINATFNVTCVCPMAWPSIMEAWGYSQNIWVPSTFGGGHVWHVAHFVTIDLWGFTKLLGS